MKQYIKIIITSLFLLLSANVHALSLSDDAIERGISETCSTYLGQIEKSYKLMNSFAKKFNKLILTTPSGQGILIK